MCDLVLETTLRRCLVCQKGLTTVNLSPGDAAPESAKHLAPFQLPSLETSSGIGFSTEPETRIQRHVIFEKCALGITCKGGRDQDRVREGDKQGGSPSGRLAVGLSHHKLAPGHGWYRRVVPA